LKGQKGQNLVELAIILGLITVVAILALTILGNNIKELYTKSFENASAYKPFEWDPQTKRMSGYISSNPRVITMPESPGQVASVSNIEGYDVTIYDDGAAAFNVAGQNVYLTKDIIEKNTVLIEGIGADGLENLVKEIAYMIQVHKDEYPNGDVPVEAVYGIGDRFQVTDNYTGTASINSLAIAVKDHVVFIQNDQGCVETNRTGSDCTSANSQGRENYHRIETHLLDEGYYKFDTYEAEKETMNVRNFWVTPDGNGKFAGHYEFIPVGDEHGLSGLNSGTWEFDFSQAENSYIIGNR
jgi:Flp pilus assembly pilin Flp